MSEDYYEVTYINDHTSKRRVILHGRKVGGEIFELELNGAQIRRLEEMRAQHLREEETLLKNFTL